MVKTVTMTRWLIDRGGHFFKNTGPLNGGPTGFLLSNITKATGISPYYFLQGIMFFPLLGYASIQWILDGSCALAWMSIKNRFHIAVCLFSDRSQMMSKCGKNKEVTLLPYFDVFCDLLLNRPTATWNLLILFCTLIRKVKRRIQIPASYRLTVWGFVLI